MNIPFLFIYFYFELRMELRAFLLLVKHSTTELNAQPQTAHLDFFIYGVF